MSPQRWINGNTVFAIIVIIAYVTIFVSGQVELTPARVTLLLLFGAPYLFLGVVGYGYCLRRSNPLLIWLYFAVQFVLGGSILYVSDVAGISSFLLLPLPAQAVFALSGRGATLVATLTVATLTFLIAGLASWTTALNVAISFTGGVLFVLVFSYLALSEERAREEVERLLAELQEANDKLRQYAVQVEELATVKERNRLAREIHDSLGHYLTVINVQMQAAQALLATDQAQAQTALQKAQTLAQQGLAEVRRSVAALRAAPVENRSLPEALADLVEENRAAGIVTELELLGDFRPLSPQVTLTLYRAAQEGLTNARKHARASRVDLTLDYRRPDQMQLTIQDNGVGAEDTANGFGLLGIQERVQLLQGKMELVTGRRQGFRLAISLPA